MKNMLAVAVGTVPLFVTSAALAQNGTMMNGSMGGGGWMGGFGGYWLPVLLVVVLGLVAWIVMQRRTMTAFRTLIALSASASAYGFHCACQGMTSHRPLSR